MTEETKSNIRAINCPTVVQKTAENILKEAEGKFDTVVVFGYNNESEIECYSNAGSLSFVNLMVDQFKQGLVNYDFEDLDE